MDNIYISRIGIILSTLGGFLAAPEVIGLDRIVRFQKWLARSAGIIRPALDDAYDWAYGDAIPPRHELNGLATYANFVFLFTVLPATVVIYILVNLGIIKNIFTFPFWIRVIIFCFIGPIFVYFANWKAKPTSLYFRSGCIFLLFQYPVALLYISGLPAWYLITLIIFIISIPIQIIENYFSGKDKLKHFLTKVGVVSLILGAILQFIAAK